MILKSKDDAAGKVATDTPAACAATCRLSHNNMVQTFLFVLKVERADSRV